MDSSLDEVKRGTHDARVRTPVLHVRGDILHLVRYIFSGQQKYAKTLRGKLPTTERETNIMTLPSTRHYHTTPTHATPHNSTQYQMWIIGEKIGRNGSLLASTHESLRCNDKLKANFNKNR